ncbi:MAG: hypothetical protein LBN32_00730 [Helicobacteraceae bacterium]|nr:hypothetical protein [Helicobacteraceae bacterium]
MSLKSAISDLKKELLLYERLIKTRLRRATTRDELMAILREIYFLEEMYGFYRSLGTTGKRAKRDFFEALLN